MADNIQLAPAPEPELEQLAALEILPQESLASTPEHLAKIAQAGMQVGADGFAWPAPSVQVIPKSRKITFDPFEYAINTADNDSWHLLSTSNDVDPFAGVAVPSGSTAFILNKTVSLAANGEGVDLVCLDNPGLQAQAGHPDWISEKTGLDRFQAINWPQVTGTTGTYTQPANYYTTAVTNGHGTATMSVAAGRRYGFAKEANLYSIGRHAGVAGLWDTAQAIDLVRLFHTGKADKSRPTVFMANIAQGIFPISAPNGAATPARIAGSLVTVDLSTSGGRTAAQQNYNIPVFTGTETYFNSDDPTVAAAFLAAMAAGVIIVHSAGNWNQRSVPAGHPNYNDYFQDGAGPFVIYFNRNVTSSATDVISVGAYDSNYVSGEEALATYTTRGPLVDIFAPGSGVPAATIAADFGVVAGTVLYPGSTTAYTKLFGGTSSAAPAVAGVVACLAQLRPWMTSLDAKAAVKEFAIKDRIYVSTPDSLNNKLAFVGAPNSLAHYPFTHVSSGA